MKVIVLLGFVSRLIFADGAFLDSPYSDLVHPVEDSQKKFTPLKSDTLSLIKTQTPVRSQVKRGTCSIFSAVALVEGLLIATNVKDQTVDLSEEWLQYTVNHNSTTEGSSSYYNFSAIKKYGLPSEATLPYIGYKWSNTSSYPLQQERCGHLQGVAKTKCDNTHFDWRLLGLSDREILDPLAPYHSEEFVSARSEARVFKKNYLTNVYYNRVYTRSDIKSLLSQGTPLTMGIEFYYGAWNHRKATEYGIGRDTAAWTNGVVGYPAYGSVDRQKSPLNRAGHSIVIVGYDDNKVVTTKVLMQDGTYKEFSYKGVYYFKNSWGVSSFGINTLIEDQRFSGYGMITQKYAHEKGSFYQLNLNL